MRERLTLSTARLGQRMIDFALDSAQGRHEIERYVRGDAAVATALAPNAWFDSALLWVGLRLAGARGFALR